jgi:hypothetical protein
MEFSYLFDDENNEDKSKKRVTFSFMQEIRYIPNNDDICDEGLKTELWWTHEEFIENKNTAMNEFAKTLRFNPGKNYRYLFKNMWYELDFDSIYELHETYKLTHKIELKKLYSLYIIKIKQ